MDLLGVLYEVRNYQLFMGLLLLFLFFPLNWWRINRRVFNLKFSSSIVYLTLETHFFN